MKKIVLSISVISASNAQPTQASTFPSLIAAGPDLNGKLQIFDAKGNNLPLTEGTFTQNEIGYVFEIRIPALMKKYTG